MTLLLFAQIVTVWCAVSFLFAIPLALLGYRSKLIRKMQTVGQLGQHVSHDFAELGGLSQRHVTAFTSASEHNHA